MPGMSNPAATPIAWLNTLIGAADRAVKRFCKRNLELSSYVEYYSGTEQRDIVLRERPVLEAMTTITAGSNGAALPQATINVASTANFSPGTGGDTSATPPTIALQTGLTTWTTVTYTAVTATTFTGCTGGTGTLSSTAGLNGVYTPVVWFDPGGYYGQAPNAFSSGTPTSQGTQLVLGTQYAVVLDSGGKQSHQGLLRRLGGSGAGWPGWYPGYQASYYGGKLAAYRNPCWPRGDGNLLVKYSAGYLPNKIPFDLQYACTMLVAYMVRNMPNGSPLSGEGLGNYNYSVLTQNKDVPEIGSIQRILAPYRESSW